MADKFRVFMFHSDGTNSEETVHTGPVEAERAIQMAKRLTDSIPAQIGSITQVKIVDAGDLAVFDWQYGKGVVFPPKPEGNPDGAR